MDQFTVSFLSTCLLLTGSGYHGEVVLAGRSVGWIVSEVDAGRPVSVSVLLNW